MGQAALLPLLNGVKHLETLAKRFGPQHVLNGLTAVNAALAPNGDIVQSPVKIDMTGFGELNGAVSDRCLTIQRAFIAGGMTANVREGIMVPMWRKFCGFTTIATVATVCRSRAGGIAAAPAAASFISCVIDECARIATAEGYPPPADDTAMIHGMFSQPDSKYGPSILVDMEEGHKTEGEHTIGDMVDRAERHGIAAPILTAARCNLQVYELLRSKN